MLQCSLCESYVKEYVRGKGRRCRACVNKCAKKYQRSKRVQEYQKEYKQRNRVRLQKYMRGQYLRREYGLTLKQYEGMLNTQEGKCAICERAMAVPAIDHCHATGAVRDLLCTGCNQGLGLFKDSPKSLRRAAAYIERHRSRGDTHG